MAVSPVAVTWTEAADGTVTASWPADSDPNIDEYLVSLDGGTPYLTSVLLVGPLPGDVGHTITVTPSIADTLASTAIFTPDPIGGIWAIKQTDLSSDVDSSVDSALAVPDIKGFSQRLQLTTVTTDGTSFSNTIPDLGKAKAAAAGRQHCLRLIYGRHIPNKYFTTDQGPKIVDGGYNVPLPWGDGVLVPHGQPNTVFEGYFQRAVNWQVGYARANGHKIVHFGWYSKDYSELLFDSTIRGQVDYTYARFLTAHERLVDIATAACGSDLIAEFPMSGTGPVWDDGTAAHNNLVADLARYIAGKTATQCVIQLNGFGPAPTGWTVPTRFAGQAVQASDLAMQQSAYVSGVGHAAQMIQPGDYDWDAILPSLANWACRYVEIYCGTSFSGAHAARLAAWAVTLA